jgi:NAD(P)H-hydrate epimerase
MLRLMGAQDKSALDDRVAAARDFATAHHVILVLKGSRPLVATPMAASFINPTGNAGLGTQARATPYRPHLRLLAQATARSKIAKQSHRRRTYVGGLAGDFAAEIRHAHNARSDIREHFRDAILSSPRTLNV